ncbi:MAG TPA: hypothetical protein PKD54_06910 [Pirellulaceae bacterium]|nr:hypothetical protein [Pirellulaceae bacterium]
MQLDDLKHAWAAQERELKKSLVINERLLRETLLRNVRAAFVPVLIVRSVEVALGVVTIMATMSVLAKHATEPSYLVVAGGLALLAGYVTGLCVFALMRTLKLDYSAPVTTLQRAVEEIRLAEYRAFKWTLLIGIVAWLPISLVLLEALTGVAALAHVAWPWLAVNILFGVVCAAIGQGISRRFVERADLAPWARRLMESLSGRAVKSAAEYLAELSRFENNE